MDIYDLKNNFLFTLNILIHLLYHCIDNWINWMSCFVNIQPVEICIYSSNFTTTLINVTQINGNQHEHFINCKRIKLKEYVRSSGCVLNNTIKEQNSIAQTIIQTSFRVQLAVSFACIIKPFIYSMNCSTRYTTIIRT